MHCAEASHSRSRARLIPAGLAALAQALVLLLLWFGLAAPPEMKQRVASALSAFDVGPSPERPKPPVHHHHPQSGRAAPPHARATAAPVMAAPHPLPKPMPAAPHPGAGAQMQNGAALAGPGSGAGGNGNGTGSGDSGNGAGDDGTPPDWIGGSIKDSDYPASARDAHQQGTTHTEITVGLNGRASACKVTRSSGNRDLDDTTCRLAMKRFRFRPARDARGQPVVDSVDYVHDWTLSSQPDE